LRRKKPNKWKHTQGDTPKNPSKGKPSSKGNPSPKKKPSNKDSVYGTPKRQHKKKKMPFDIPETGDDGAKEEEGQNIEDIVGGNDVSPPRKYGVRFYSTVVVYWLVASSDFRIVANMPLLRVLVHSPFTPL